MLKRQSNIRIVAVSFFVLLLSTPLLAQEARPTLPGRERITREVNGRTITIDAPTVRKTTQANFLQYRNDLQIIMGAQKESAKLLHLEGRVGEILDPLLPLIAALKFSDVPPDYPGFPDLTALKAAVLQQQQVLLQAFAESKTKATQYVPTDPFPGAQYALNLCPLNPQPGEVAYSSGLALLVAESVRDLAQDACNQTILAFVYGGNFRIVCLITDAVFAALRIANYPIQFCDTNTLQGQLKGSNLRTEYIKDQLAFSINNDNTNKALLSTQLANAENHIVNNDNNNKAALGSQAAAFQALFIKSAMEHNLIADPNTISAIGLFQLPASQGGYLEAVRQLVVDTYNAQVAAAGAGVTVYNPANELSLAANFTSQGKYREAYYYYRKAYRSIVKYP